MMKCQTWFSCFTGFNHIFNHVYIPVNFLNCCFSSISIIYCEGMSVRAILI